MVAIADKENELGDVIRLVGLGTAGSAGPAVVVLVGLFAAALAADGGCRFD